MGLGRESAVRWDVRKGVKSEVRKIGGWRWNWVSPDTQCQKKEKTTEEYGG